MNFWQRMTQFIDDKYDSGSLFLTRQELIKTLYGKVKHIRWTMDNYRRYLTKAGFLNETDRLGQYTIVMPVRGKSLGLVRHMAYPHLKIMDKLASKGRWAEKEEYHELYYVIKEARQRKKELEDLAASL